MSDDVSKKIEREVADLKDKVRDRLKETEDLGDLEAGLQDQAFGLKKTTEEHQQVSRETKNKMFWKYAKWTLLILIIVGLLCWLVLKPLIKELLFL